MAPSGDTTQTDTKSAKFTLRRFGTLFLLGSLGVIALFTTGDITIYEEAADTAGIAVETLMLIAAIQSLVLLGVAVLVGLYFAPMAGFGSHLLSRISNGTSVIQSIRSELPIALGMGTLIGVLLLIAEWFAPTPMDTQAAVTVNTLLGSLPMRVLYGGITEELLLRWGVMSLLVVILWKVLARKTAQPPSGIVWVAIVLSAVLFGIGHLPAAATIYGAITVDVLVFILLGNGVAGIVFGWLYWQYSLEAAMIAHGVGHLVAVGGRIVLLLV